jgi:DNA (cytosine-5)-methyltransferase 1
MGKDVTIRSIDPEAIRRIDELIPPGVSREEVLRRSIETRWMGEVEPQLSLFSDAVEPTVVFGDMPFRFIDLFAGIGGFRSALTRLGGECVYTSEWDKYAAMTYEAWYGERPDQTDIREVDYDAIPDHDVLAAGFPCQPFSLAGVSKKNSLGRLHGFEDEKQGNLFFSILDIIDAKKPPVIFLENVKNLKSHDRGNTWKVISEELVDRGYEVHHQVIDAAGWVPQHRQRVFIVGFHRDVFNATATSFFHFPHLPDERPTFGSILEPDPDPKYTLSDRLWEYLQDYREKHEAKGNGFGYGLAPLDGVCRTMSARYHKDGSEILIKQGRRNPRRLTPREAARLLGFDGDYSELFGHGEEFPQVVSDTQAYRQFGNAVVPKVVEAIGRCIRTTMAAAISETDGGCLLKGRTAKPTELTALDPAA